jgi:hypothetical protein
VLNIEIVDGIKKNVHQIRIGGEPRAARSWWLPLNHNFWNAEIIRSRDSRSLLAKRKEDRVSGSCPRHIETFTNIKACRWERMTFFPWIIPWWHPLGIIWLSHDYEMEHNKNIIETTNQSLVDSQIRWWILGTSIYCRDKKLNCWDNY